MAETRPCPLCTSDVPWPWPPHCPYCAAPLRSDAARELAELDTQIAALGERRQQLAEALVASRAQHHAAQPGTSHGAGAAPAADVTAPPGATETPDRGDEVRTGVSAGAGARRDGAGPPPQTGPAGRGLAGLPAQTLLAGAGVLLLAVAAIVFVAVTWEQLSGLSRALILLAATAVAAVATRVLARRGLATTADAVGILTVALALVDVHGGRALGLLGLDVVPQGLYIALTSLLLAPLARALAGWSGTRAPRAAAAALLVSVGPALAAYLVDRGWDEEPVISLLGLAASGGLAVERRRVRGAGAPWERGLLGLGAAFLWVAAFAAAPAALVDEVAAVWEDLLAAVWTAPTLAAAGDWPSFGLALLVVASIPAFLASVGRRRQAWWAAGAVAAAAVLAATVVGGLPAWLRVAAGLVVAAVATAASARAAVAAPAPAARRAVAGGMADRLPSFAATVLAALAASLWTLGWALADAWLTTAALALLAAGAGALAWQLGDASRRRVAGAASAALALAALTTAVPAAGASWATAGLVVAVGASVTLLAAGRLVDPEDLPAAELVTASAAAFGIALAVAHTDSLGGADTARVAGTFAVTGVAGVIHALSTRRWFAGYVGSTLLSGAVWTLLADAEISTVEYYTLPLGLLLVVVGMWHLAIDRETSSMSALSAGLSVGLAPTAIVILGDPADVLRVVLLAAAGALLLVAGGWRRLAAPILYGAGAIAVATLTQLAVAADHLPRWVTFAVLGLLLVAFSATYERQRRRLAAARTRLAALR